MKHFYKNIMSLILAAVFVLNITGNCYAQEKPTYSEQCYMEGLCPSDELEEYVESVEGIKAADVTEENVSVKDAVEEVFCNDEIIETEMKDSETTEYNDVTYITEIYEEDGVTYAKTYSEDMLQMSVVSYDGENINSDQYYYNEKIGEYEKQHMELICEDMETSGDNTVFAQAISYTSKTKSAKWKDTTYWYQVGNESKKTYLKIGCKATYRIRTDNLTSAKDKKCDAYMRAVKSSKSYEKKALAYASAAGISGTAIIALVLANAAFPPSTIISIVFGILGGGATIYNAINYTVDSFEKWQDAKDYFNTIKAYGKKL